jgi:hypothetical protein
MADGNDESQYVVETAAQKLARLGLMDVMSPVTLDGDVPLLAVSYATSTYKQQERFDITQELPRDSGQGYQFTNINNTEV